MRIQLMKSRIKRNERYILAVIALVIVLILGLTIFGTPMSWIRLKVESGGGVVLISIDHGDTEYVFVDGVFERVYRVWPGTHTVFVKFGVGFNSPLFVETVRTTLFETEQVTMPNR